jgi:hypothetical protein
VSFTYKNEASKPNRRPRPLESEAAFHPATVQPGSGGGTIPRTILVLQRSAGNRSVAQLIDGHRNIGTVQRQNKPAPLPTYGTGETGQPIHGLGPGLLTWSLCPVGNSVL